MAAQRRDQHSIARTLELVALLLGLGCGPQSGAGDHGNTGDGDATGTGATATGESGGTSPAGADTTADVTTSTSTGEPDCPNNVANEPFCYRLFDLEDVHTSSKSAAGRFGPSGEHRIAFLHHDRQDTLLLGWTGTDVALEPQNLASPGARAWTPAVVFDSQRDDLVGEDLPDIVHLIPNSAEGLRPVLSTEVAPDVHPYWPLLPIDLDADGFDELLVQHTANPGVSPVSVLQPYRWDGTTWTPWGDFITPIEDLCNVIWQMRKFRLDNDGRYDVVFSTGCLLDDPALYGFVTMLSTDEPLVFNSELHAIDPPAEAYWLDVADFDGNGNDDVAYLTGHAFANPRRIEILLSAGDGSLGPPQIVWAEGDPLYVDYMGDCDYGFEDWNTADLDGDGRSELICGRTAVTSLTESPTVVELVSVDRLGGTASAQILAVDLTGDGIDELVLGSRRTDGDGRMVILVSE